MWLPVWLIEVRGESMAPAHAPGSRTLVWAWAYVWQTPRRGDVVVLRSPDDPASLALKRIVGLPGENVSWAAASVRIDGRPLPEPYARVLRDVPGDDEMLECALGPDEYFVLGDNRLYSHDSRHYGPVRRPVVLGRVLRSRNHL